MPNIEYLKATENDFEQLIDLINLVFGTYGPQNFEAMLPAQYAERNFMSGANYIVKEDGRIVASVGAYPAKYFVCGDILKINGITAVAVHSRARSKGYMKKLMEMALQDMRNDNTDLSFLIGLRQRYEYFGYSHCGTRFTFTCNTHNISHHFGKAAKAKITLKEVDAKDIKIFDAIYDMYSTASVYIKRPRERFIDIISTWENKTLAIYNENRFAGYLSVSKDYSSINELFIDDMSLFGNTLNVFLEQFKRYDVSITTYLHETYLNTSLSKFADSISVIKDDSLYVISYINVLNSFIKLKCEYTKIPDGALTFDIQDVGNITISISNNHPSVTFTDEKPDVTITQLEAMQLFFSHFSAYSLGQLEGNTFARCLFPIPLFVRRQDRS
ncbi:MAG: GNAT family N-acetyltransferase [Oscillospiraceae bacterium]|jgi:predicted acetyltransferase|nr:GNAT family N-acetyltransferase [Oscillospiraceae bacterium]